MKAFKGYRPNPPLSYHANDAGLTNLGELPDYEGVIFEDGTVAVRWLTTFRSVSLWMDFDTFYAVHGHPEYGTRIEWHTVIKPSAEVEGEPPEELKHAHAAWIARRPESSK